MFMFVVNMIQKTFQHILIDIDTRGQRPMISASAPGKCVLFGEHAVVYGQPALAIALDLRTTVSINTSDMLVMEGRQFYPSKHPHIAFLLSKLWNNTESHPPLSIDIESAIPSASGLGSSAALSTALAACLRAGRGRYVDKNEQWQEGWSSFFRQHNAYTNEDEPFISTSDLELKQAQDAVSVDECSLLGHAAEAFAQGGLASPMDASTSAHGGGILLSPTIGNHFTYTRSLDVHGSERTWNIHNFMPTFPEGTYIVVGATGVHASTKKQVEHVAQLVASSEKYREYITTIGEITTQGAAALSAGDMEQVGVLMNQNQILLERLEVSSTPLRRLIRAAFPTSFGVKLSGAGGGGCMIALTDQPEQTAEAILSAGGSPYITSMSQTGVKLESYHSLLSGKKTQ